MKSLKHIGGRAVSWTLGITAAITLVLSMAVSLFPGAMRLAQAAVQNYGPGVAVYTMPMTLAGDHSAANAVVTRFKIPYAARLIGFSAAAETIGGGVNSVVTVDLRAGGVSLLSAPVELTAGAVVNAVVSTSAVADEAELTAYLDVTGTNAVVSYVTMLPTFLRR